MSSSGSSADLSLLRGSDALLNFSKVAFQRGTVLAMQAHHPLIRRLISTTNEVHAWLSHAACVVAVLQGLLRDRHFTCCSRFSNVIWTAGWFSAKGGCIVVKSGADGGFVTSPAIYTSAYDDSLADRLIYLNRNGKRLSLTGWCLQA